MSWERALQVALVATEEAGRILSRPGGPRSKGDKAEADVEAACFVAAQREAARSAAG